MKATKALLIVGVALAVGSTVVGLIVAKRRAEKPGAQPVAASPATVAQRPVQPTATVATDLQRIAPETAPPAASQRAAAITPAAQSNAKPANAPLPKPKKEIQDPVARDALRLVGVDPEAEAYWYEAINDPGLSGNERQDLIEDLNEDGLTDPRRPGPEDLPLIVSRLLLIEEIAADAMDKVNADAFQEAYKDLSNMYVRLTQPPP